MKKWSGAVILVFLFTLLILRYGILENPLAERLLPSPLSRNSSEPLDWLNSGLPAIQNPGNGSRVVSANAIVSRLFAPRNLSDAEQQSLQTWNHLDRLINYSNHLPQAMEAIREAGSAWEDLMAVFEDKKLNRSTQQKVKEKQCPYSIKKMNITEFGNDTFKLKLPCGLVQGSSITLIGTPGGLLGNFQIDLIGTALPGEPDPPIIFHYNVRLHGDKLTEDPVIVQNTWSVANDWGAEERCPSDIHPTSKKGNNFLQYIEHYSLEAHVLFLAMISFLYPDVKPAQCMKSLEPWLVNEVRISGDMKLISVLASGLPTSEDLEHVIDLELLKSNPLPIHQAVKFFIGIISTANNFKHRMAVRRTWMQYDLVRTGAVVVRFFVGLVSSYSCRFLLSFLILSHSRYKLAYLNVLWFFKQHKNQMVNEELWNEASTYGDIQLMPFVDYYSLITWKTIAICIYGVSL
ncbi:hypothetical protein BHE74_00029694 [Ensete ventricosum]|nr:hypothetical protein BHE74_00029694 [Ensete ventricosum]